MKNLKKSKYQVRTYKNCISKVKVLSIACFSMFVGLTSCSKDDVLNPNGNCGNSVWTQQVEKEITAWSNASVAYSSDPSPANCNNYKSAGKNYLNALDGIKKCVAGVNAKEFNQAIQDAKNEIDALNCQ